ncbi:MAG: PaaI family thioesterase [Acholeplasmatales bacterium]|jgi:acyl-coenzyme A thioesterase PaaI-like protein|nr:PaaI family thioesterase [Acholeplasmatales bacterium]
MQQKIIKKQNNSSSCFICGLNNSFGFKARFYELENKQLVSIVTGDSNHQSYPNRMHGGLISALLDETIGRAIQIYHSDLFGVTTSLSIKYRKPVPLNKKLIVIGTITSDTRLLFEGEGAIYDTDFNLLATATGKYMKIDFNKISEKELDEHSDWFFEEDLNPLQYIEIPEA